jgi:diguanylate cyclase (GGDEF)-like protein
VAETGKPLFVPNVREEPRFSKKIEELNPFSTESVICIPLKVRNKVLGVIELINKENISCFNQYDMEILTTVAEYAAIALENAKNYEKVQKLTVTDDITCLYNSRHLHNILHSEVEKAKKARKKFSIIFFDLDAFKLVNDSHGHRIGSRLLGRIGKFISENLKEGYYAARYGGDEFVIILPNTSKNHALEYCRGLLNKLNSEKFFSEEGLNICLTASFGIATFPDDADNKDDVLHVADARMYRVKERQKNDIEYS